jgi:hypothetical protein
LTKIILHVFFHILIFSLLKKLLTNHFQECYDKYIVDDTEVPLNITIPSEDVDNMEVELNFDENNLLSSLDTGNSDSKNPTTVPFIHQGMSSNQDNNGCLSCDILKAEKEELYKMIAHSDVLLGKCVQDMDANT